MIPDLTNHGMELGGKGIKRLFSGFLVLIVLDSSKGSSTFSHGRANRYLKEKSWDKKIDS